MNQKSVKASVNVSIKISAEYSFLIKKEEFSSRLECLIAKLIRKFNNKYADYFYEELSYIFVYLINTFGLFIDHQSNRDLKVFILNKELSFNTYFSKNPSDYMDFKTTPLKKYDKEFEIELNSEIINIKFWNYHRFKENINLKILYDEDEISSTNHYLGLEEK